MLHGDHIHTLVRGNIYGLLFTRVMCVCVCVECFPMIAVLFQGKFVPSLRKLGSGAVVVERVWRCLHQVMNEKFSRHNTKINSCLLSEPREWKMCDDAGDV